MIACRGRLFQQNRVAHRLDPHQAQTARKGFILCHRDGFGGPLASQARTLLLAVCHDGLFNATVELLLGPLGGTDKLMEARDLQEETHQAHPTGAHFRTHQVERQDESMQEGEPRNTVTKCHNRGARIQALLVGLPRPQRAAGNGQGLGGFPLGGALCWESVVLLKERRAFEAIPAGAALLVASFHLLDYGAHSDLLCPPFAFVSVMAKDGGVAFSLQPFVGSSHGLPGAVIETKWPTP